MGPMDYNFICTSMWESEGKWKKIDIYVLPELKAYEEHMLCAEMRMNEIKWKPLQQQVKWIR